MDGHITSRRRKRAPLITLVALAVLTALLVAAVAGPAAAKRPKAPPFAAQTLVTSVDTSAGTVTAKLVRANRPLKSLVGSDVTFTLGEKTLIVKLEKEAGPSLITLADIAAGDRLLIHGRVDRSDASAPVYRAFMLLDRGPAPAK